MALPPKSARRLVAACAALWLVAEASAAQTPAAAPAPQPLNPDYAAVREGAPIDARPPEISGGRPVFPGQTRAPYHRATAYQVKEITNELRAPWSLAFLPSGNYLVTERLPGALRVISPDGQVSPPVAGLEGLAVEWPQTGLLDLALDPRFTANHRLYFTFFAFDKGMISGLRVARATFDERANALRDVTVIFKARPQTPNDSRAGTGTRSGGRLAFGPDGYLYLTVGDRDTGGSFPWRVAQTLDTHLGKILRITTDGRPAPGNPFARIDGAYPEIWALGLRSQEGLAFDSQGALWTLDHGPRGGDELDRVEKGGNYGWPIVSHGVDYPGPPIGEGAVAREGMLQPVYYWSPSVAPSGLAFYGANRFPAWRNSWFLGTLRGAALVRLGMADGKVAEEEVLLTDLKMRIRDVRVGPDGAVYVLTDTGGSVISPNTPKGSKLLRLTPG